MTVFDPHNDAGHRAIDGLHGPASLAECEWVDPAARGRLSLGTEVHLWVLPLDTPPRPAAELAASLDEAERARAARLSRPVERHRFIVGRGLLRLLLGAYVGLPAAQVSFDHGPFGKPVLARGSGASPPSFNLSHADGWALLGVTRGGAIGVDLERVGPIPERDLLARQFFAPGEVASFARLPPSRVVDGFYACWTRKEAFLKLTGEGLSRATTSFEVTTDPDGPAMLVSVDGSADAGHPYRFWSGRLLGEYRAALAVEGGLPALRFMRL